MDIIGYNHTKELVKRRTPERDMIIYMTEDLIMKKRKITPETYMIICMTECLIKKERRK